MSKRFIYTCNICKLADVDKRKFVGVIKNLEGKLVAIVPDRAEIHICYSCKMELKKD